MAAIKRRHGVAPATPAEFEAEYGRPHARGVVPRCTSTSITPSRSSSAVCAAGHSSCTVLTHARLRSVDARARSALQDADASRCAVRRRACVGGRARDLRRRRDHKLNPALDQLARECVSGRPSLIRNPNRPRQTRPERGRIRVLAVHHEHLRLAHVGIEDRRDDLRRVHVQTTRDLAFATAGSSYAVVNAARGATRTATNPTNASRGASQYLRIGPDDSLHTDYADPAPGAQEPGPGPRAMR